MQVSPFEFVNWQIIIWTMVLLNLYKLQAPAHRIGYGVVANIIASHAIARGSIPRIRILEKLYIVTWPWLLDKILPDSKIKVQWCPVHCTPFVPP